MRENRLSGSMQGRREKQRNWQLRPVKSLCLTRLLYCQTFHRLLVPRANPGLEDTTPLGLTKGAPAG